MYMNNQHTQRHQQFRDNRKHLRCLTLPPQKPCCHTIEKTVRFSVITLSNNFEVHYGRAPFLYLLLTSCPCEGNVSSTSYNAQITSIFTHSLQIPVTQAKPNTVFAHHFQHVNSLRQLKALFVFNPSIKNILENHYNIHAIDEP